jgi:nucleoside-diphosphate-sugar epimerase
MKVLVTGATGFFGRGIAAALRAAGHQVVGAARRPSEGDLRLDVVDRDVCDRIIGGGEFAAVVHAAALAHIGRGRVDPATCRAVNVEGTRNVARASEAGGVSHFVNISSITVYGEVGFTEPVDETYPCLATDIYGRSKIEAEEACASEAARMSVRVLRMATMYAPEWRDNVRKRVTLPGSGGRLRLLLNPDVPRYSLCSRRFGSAVVTAAISPALGSGTWNVADSHDYSQREIARALAQLEGERPTIRMPVAAVRACVATARLLLASEERRTRLAALAWKYCDLNLYSTARLQSAGLVGGADLLEIAHGRVPAAEPRLPFNDVA